MIVGRYAPSPTGDLHLGNLRTGLIAWLHARLSGGRFLLRMEDVDTPRTVTDSDIKILRDLETLGLDWDEEVLYQSSRFERYREILNQLTKQNLTYPCFCSRKDIQQAGSAPHIKPGVYPGICANLDAVQINELSGLKSPATRLRVSQALQSDCGDFVIHRADGLYAYQLAVVIDDLDQGITDVVRGADLSSSTARQIYLASLIANELTPINYHHVPLLLDEQGKRMSKRDGSCSLRQWVSSGRSVPELVGYLAHGLNLIPTQAPISTTELLRVVSLEQVKKSFGKTS